jgi:hypothetical protein
MIASKSVSRRRVSLQNCEEAITLHERPLVQMDDKEHRSLPEIKSH